MEIKITEELGSSVSFPSLKELTAKGLNNVPERYVRRINDPPIVTNTDSFQQIPIIDLSKLLSEEVKGPELEKLDIACKEWGFFQLINHGLSMALMEDMKIGAKELFNLSMEEKSKLWQKPGDMEGFGKMLDVYEDEPSDWVDLFYIFTLPSHLRKPHLFPNLPLPFRESLEKYCIKNRELANNILVLIVKALGIESNDIETLREGGQSIRINYYSPCPQPENVLGLKAHTDASALTILFQNNEVEGLQIQKDGSWISVKPLPNAFIVSLGDVMEVMTNGIYKSTTHRAIVNSTKERLSIATFYGPEWCKNIGPATSLVTPQTPPLFKTIGVADFYKGYLSPENHGKSFIHDVLRIQNEDIKD